MNFETILLSIISIVTVVISGAVLYYYREIIRHYLDKKNKEIDDFNKLYGLIKSQQENFNEYDLTQEISEIKIEDIEILKEFIISYYHKEYKSNINYYEIHKYKNYLINVSMYKNEYLQLISGETKKQEVKLRLEQAVESSKISGKIILENISPFIK